jgi:hypothetical protein
MGGLVQGWRQADADQKAQARNDSYLKTQTLKQTQAQQGIDEWNAGAETRDMKRDFEKSKMVATQALQSMTNIPDQHWGEFQARAWSALPVHGTVRFDPEQNRLMAEDGEPVPNQSREEMADLLAKFADPNAFVQIKTAELKRKETPTQYVDAQGNVRTMKPGEAGAGWNRVEDRVAGQGLQKTQADIDSTRALEATRQAQQEYYRQQQNKAGRIDVAPGHVVYGPGGQEIARGLQKGGSGSGAGGKGSGAPQPFNKQNIEQALGTMTEGFMLAKGFQKKSVYNPDTGTTTTEFVDAQGNVADLPTLQKADKVGRLAVNMLQTGQASNIVQAQQMAERKQEVFDTASTEFTSRTGFSPQQKPSEFKQFLLEYSRGLDTGYRQRVPIGNQR